MYDILYCIVHYIRYIVIVYMCSDTLPCTDSAVWS